MKTLQPKARVKSVTRQSGAKLPYLAELKRQLAEGSSNSARIAKANTRKLTGKDSL